MAATIPSYDDFEPFCKWYKEEGKQTLEVHVQGFKKEHLKVQVSNRGTLRITGECPVDEANWSRFTKEIKLPKDCATNEINAKFSKPGFLRIVMPQKVISFQKQDQETVPVQKSPSNLGPEFVAEEWISMTGKLVMKGVIAMIVLGMGVYAMYRNSRSSCSPF